MGRAKPKPKPTDERKRRYRATRLRLAGADDSTLLSELRRLWRESDELLGAATPDDAALDAVDDEIEAVYDLLVKGRG